MLVLCIACSSLPCQLVVGGNRIVVSISCEVLLDESARFFMDERCQVVHCYSVEKDSVKRAFIAQNTSAAHILDDIVKLTRPGSVHTINNEPVNLPRSFLQAVGCRLKSIY